MDLHIDRDSVAAGDDGDPHKKMLEFVGEPLLKDVIKQIYLSDYLPRLHDRRTCWVVSSERPIAVIAEHWQDPKFLRSFRGDDKLSSRPSDDTLSAFNYSRYKNRILLAWSAGLRI